MVRRIISLACCFVLCGSFMVPVKADSELIPYPGGALTPYGFVSTDFADWFVDAVASGVEDMEHDITNGAQWLYSKLNENYCNVSENHRHKFVAQHTMVDGQAGNYYVCEYCGKSAGEVSNEAYNDYIGTLPMTGIDSVGGFIWTPTAADLVKAETHVDYNGGYQSEVSDFPATISTSCSENTVGLGNGGLTLVSVPVSGSDSIGSQYAYARYVMTFRFPVGGMYSLISDSLAFSGTYTRLNGYPSKSFTSTHNNALWKRGDITSSNDGYAKNAMHISAGDIRGLFNGENLERGDTNIDYKGVVTVSASVSFPSFSVIPDSTLGGDYTDNSRPASITGDYGIINQDGELTIVNDHRIVDESDNSIYNPVTNTTLTFDGWKYDYSNRSYTFTGGNNETTTVTYGDENITIQEGDTIYYVYYTVPQPEPPAHQHNYTGTITTQPTCTMKGVKTYTCDVCGNSYTEAVPALGHDWQVKTQVQSEYNEQGEQTVQGYTIYKCSRCGEEKRSEDGIPPPSGGGDDTGLTIPDENGLQLLRDTLVNFFQTLPEMFGELTSFLNSTFSYVPQEIMTLIGFTIAVSVLMAFFKFFWR